MENEVTVGIGALCNSGDIAVIASDTRTSFPRSNVRPHDETGKTWDFSIPNPLIAAVAGRLGDCATVVSELNRLLGECSRKGEIFTEHMENAVRDARLKGWARCVDWKMRMAYGITLKQWQTGKVPSGKIDQFIHDSIRALIDGQPFDVELLLAGYSTRGNILFYKGSRKSPLEPGIAPGILVIGSGGQLAMDHLNRRGQNIEYRLPRTLLHVYEAMQKARKVPDKSVGAPQAFTIVSRDKIWRIRANAPLYEEWSKVYKNRSSTASLDSSQLAEQQASELLQKHEIKPLIVR
jgi:hypothetical protein